MTPNRQRNGITTVYILLFVLSTCGLLKLTSSSCLLKKKMAYDIRGEQSYFRNYVVYRYITCYNINTSDITKIDIAKFDPSGLNVQYVEFKNSTISFLHFGLLNSLDDAKKIHLDSCQIENVEADAFAHLFSLQELYLQNNSISSLSPKLFENLSKLLILDLSYNDLETIDPFVFKWQGQLQKLLLNGNKFKYLGTNMFRFTLNLEYLDISNNLISSLNGSLYNLLKLETLSASNNKLSNVSQSDISNATTDLTYIDLSHNSIREFDAKILPTSLETLNISNNQLSVISDMFDMISLYVLDLSNNTFTNPPDNFIKSMPNLTSLQLQNNNIGFLPSDFFSNSHNLQRVNLSSNQINIFEEGTFKGIENLLDLDISRNQLASLPEQSLFNLKKLQNLDISYNKLTEFDFQGLLQKCHDLTFLNVYGNNFHCSSLSALVAEATNLKKPKTFLRPAITVDNDNKIPCDNNTSVVSLNGENSVYIRSASPQNGAADVKGLPGQELKEVYDFFDKELQNTSLHRLYEDYKVAKDDVDLSRTKLYDIITGRHDQLTHYNELHQRIDNVHGLLVGLFVMFILVIVATASFVVLAYIRRRRNPSGSTSDYLL